MSEFNFWESGGKILAVIIVYKDDLGISLD
jgi:hypothetical protein